MGKCAVPFCLNRDGESKTTGISFHRFPKEVHMSEIWASNIGRSGWFPTHGSRICSLHFTTDSYTGGHRLKKIATPTVFIQNVKRVDKRRKVFVTVPVKVEPTVEDFRENPAALELPTSLNNGINNPSISVGLESIVEPLAVVGLEVINEPTIFTVLEIVKLPSTSICSVSLVSRTTTEKVFIVRGLDPLEIDTPRKATLLNLIRKEERSPKKQLKLRSLKWKSINLKKRVPKLKAINKDFIDIFNISLDTSQMIEGISETYFFLQKRQMD